MPVTSIMPGKYGTLPTSRKEHLLSLFTGLPASRSDRNHYQYTTEQRRAIQELRRYYTPRNLEKILDISVYQLHKIINEEVYTT